MSKMHEMNINQVDLNLLVVFDTILEEGSVTAASRRLGLSQPAVSHALGRLRDVFADPLFVRGRGGMLPTPAAAELAGPIRSALRQIEQVVADLGPFDPTTSKHTVRITTSDYAELVMMPRLMAAMDERAPGMRVEVSPVTHGSPEDDLNSGRFDLAIGYVGLSVLPPVKSVVLFRDHLSCIVRQGHPVIGDALSFRDFVKAGHILTSPYGRPGGLIDDMLTSAGSSRRVALITPHFSVAPMVVASSDLIASLANRIAETYLGLLPIKVLPIPIEAPDFAISMAWHGRYDDDPRHQWLRELLIELFAS